MNNNPTLAGEFARVIACTACTRLSSGNILRDVEENVPQPGYVGHGYWNHRILLVGQNPAVPPARLCGNDATYTKALRDLRDEPTEERYAHLAAVLRGFIPQWPIHGQYFPLQECGLLLSDVAYLNLVRCRTVDNAAPSEPVIQNCRSHHFGRWLDLLAPRCVVFIGKWAQRHGASLCEHRRIPHVAINRDRSLTTTQRIANRLVVQLAVQGQQSPNSSPYPQVTFHTVCSDNIDVWKKPNVNMTPAFLMPIFSELKNKWGLSDNAYKVLHHAGHSMNDMENYLQSGPKSFRGENIKLGFRLLYILELCRKRNVVPVSAAVFTELVRDAKKLVDC